MDLRRHLQTSPIILPIALPPLSLYLHIPWCIKKCPYCDFNSHAANGALPEARYVDALLTDLAADIAFYAIDRPIHSIFIGGGTPSLFQPESFVRLLDGIATQIRLEENLEITLEANPGTFESAKFKAFRALGINRLSIGIQSFNDKLLTRLGRVHSGSEAINAVEIAQQAGFDNFNLDLMFGLPGAGLDDARRDMETALSLKPKHISYYQLTLEPNTYFHKFPPKLPGDDTIFTIQSSAQALLAEHGFRQYEISAYSQAGLQCRHNLNYWRFGDYLGIGAGAHGKISLALPDKILRTCKFKKPETYLNAADKNADVQAIAIADLPLEFVMNQLRLRQGFTQALYTAATGLAVASLEPGLSACQNQGLLVCQQGRYACTQRGFDMLDDVLQNFIA